MSTPHPAGDTDRAPRALSRATVLAEAVALADRIGIEPFTIRRLADALGVGPMSIYHHVPNKEAILDGMVDLVFSEIDPPPEGLRWKDAVRVRCVSARTVLRRHPWAPPLMESRSTPGPETLRHHDAVLGCLRGGGLSLQLTAHAYAVLDSYLYGFALEEANLPVGGRGEIAETAERLIEPLPAGEYPHLVELATEHVLRTGYDFGDSFEFGLDLLLDGLEAAARAEEPAHAQRGPTR